MIATTRHRDDIQGLRAVAVLLVVLGHAGVAFLKGGYVGVDVFFVLSGYLITGLLVSDAAKRRYVSFTNFYARRARRILPAAALTLIVTDVAAYQLLNFIRAKQAIIDSVWASVFAANVRFAQQGVNYFAQTQPPSPFQHFWSLAVEEQFYLVWPAVIAVALFGLGRRAARRRHRRPHASRGLRRALLAIGFIGLASFAWSVYYTPKLPPAAYFSTFTRVWELGLGAGIAITSVRLARIPRRAALTLGWLGMAGIALAAVVLSGATPFPGWVALLPTLGTGLVIAAGIREEQHAGSTSRLLRARPLLYVGDRSYAFYLWHWPALVIGAEYVGHSLSLAQNLALAALAFLVSIFSYALVENPIRRSRWSLNRTALLWPVSVGAVAVVAIFALRSINAESARFETATSRPIATLAPPTPVATPSTTAVSPGAASTTVGASSAALPAVIDGVRAAERNAPLPAGLTPPVTRLTSDSNQSNLCQAPPGSAVGRVCRFGRTGSSKVVVLIGDSHVQMWWPAILKTATDGGWSVIPFIKDGCVPERWVAAHPEALQLANGTVGGKPECLAWIQWALSEVRALHPEATLVGGSLNAGLRSPNGLRDSVGGIRLVVDAAKAVSTHVVVIGDPFAEPFDPVNCLLGTHATLGSCTGTPTPDQLGLYSAVGSAADEHGASFIDTSGWFCFENRCPLVIGRTITRLDESHITQTYATELSGVFEAAFRSAAPT